MRGLLFKVQRFINNLQNATLATRRRWLVGLSGVSMILVVALWVVYLNVAFPSFGNTIETATSTPETAEETTPTQNTTMQTQENSFLDTLWRGFRVTSDNVRNELYSIGRSITELWDKTTGVFSETNSYELKERGGSPTETIDIPDPIPPTPLP